MGATVVTGKTVSAFRNPKSGEVIYLIFEQTYEKNCYPHTPSWGCRAIGTFEQVFQRVFATATACEGGMVQSRSGNTKPENYIKSWRICFSEPFQMDDLEFELKLGGTSMYDRLPDSHVEKALAMLERIGRKDIADALKVGPVTVSLHRDVDVIIGLYGVDTELPIWKLIDDLRGLGYADESLAPPLGKRDIAIPSVVAYAFDKENMVIGIGGAPLKHLGWRYSAVGHYILDVALPIEMQSSFSAYKLIREFRDTCDAAPELPDDTIITVTPAKAEHSHYMGNAKKLAVKLGLYASVDDVPESYETTFGLVREMKEEYFLSTLEISQTTWALSPSTNVADLLGLIATGHAHQQSLF
ncbi:hypothetical protein SAMN05880566_13320 [Janthinobacterium sp. TND4EL3]|uniref:hypothetical protein n=1 Tax=Janthinobacterium sp. TND4EL3 TaxID=1907311 RepID=UPI0009568E7B|nr:hypothetical protein [Janthinobacterium sp. TND4EL3]SIR88149.1 hypothetical protein SAMN05880566_13320 [Janthinobacterium sp. TND4EL3]